MDRTQDLPANEFEYVFEVEARKHDIQTQMKDIDGGKDPLSTSREWYGRLNSELRAIEEWKNGKRPSPTTGDKAILHYFPLPPEPSPQEDEDRRISGFQFPRKLAHQVYKTHPTASGRSAWNLLPNVWGKFITIEKHTKVPAKENGKARKTATAIFAVGDEKYTITFKQFERAWDRVKEDSEAARWIKEKRELMGKAKNGDKIL